MNAESSAAVLRAVARVSEDSRSTRSYAEQGHARGGHALVFEATVAGSPSGAPTSSAGMATDSSTGEGIPKVMAETGLR